ncbi:MAG: hypothetical protein UT33_C0005G0076 [Candidatus Peregrinibacteria bacterium GW2011_GWC2_39_14]|nr:MAG: hypothetical protein US92_C0001G0076 [Candidatus Peregrinibacteria bacterium GW2011_GWA2_38_36]KKR07132.1 MAG: hypothetical protein UT33_C0005G0076 [Candidatus Peregrinibacteria bacterium GW2011_GWC2_39_14]
MDVQKVFKELETASVEVKTELESRIEKPDKLNLSQILKIVHWNAMQCIAGAMVDSLENPTKEQLQSAIDLSGSDFLPYNEAHFEAVIKGEVVPTDPGKKLVVEYIIKMRKRLDSIWESANA